MNKIFTSVLLFILVITVFIRVNFNKIIAGNEQELSHGKSAEPNYSIVFPNDNVNRIDIRIDKNQWEEMNTYLESNFKSSRSMPHPQAENLTEGHPQRHRGPMHGNHATMPFENNNFTRGRKMAIDSIHNWEQGRRPGPPGVPPGGHPGAEKSESIWAYCDVYFNQQQWNKVGIRFKGNSSLRSTCQMGLKKFSFKLDFDQFEEEFPEIKNQRFYGFKQLNLKNNYNDPTFMREKVAADLFAEFGLVTPKTSFCQVFIDYGEGSQYFGMYTLVEEVDDTVIETLYESEDGNLYKPDGHAATFARDSFNKAAMNKKNNKNSKNLSDVQKLNEIINSTLRTENYERWKLQLSEIFDIPVFLKYLAANNVIQNWDTYGNSTHNFYLYNNPASNKLEWIPWDNNEAFQPGKMRGALSLSLNEIGENWPLIRYIIDDKDWNAEYENYVSGFTQNIFNPEKMTIIFDDYRQLITGSVVGDQGEQKQYSFLNNDTEFYEALGFLKDHVYKRQSVVQEFIEQQNF